MAKKESVVLATASDEHVDYDHVMLSCHSKSCDDVVFNR